MYLYVSLFPCKLSTSSSLTGVISTILGKQGLCLDTLDAARLEKIRSLEATEAVRQEEAAPEMQKPVFTTPLNK